MRNCKFHLENKDSKRHNVHVAMHILNLGRYKMKESERT